MNYHDVVDTQKMVKSKNTLNLMRNMTTSISNHNNTVLKL